MAKSYKQCEIVQQVKFLSEEDILKSIKYNSNSYIEKWSYILHNQDTKEDGTLKEPHWHIFLKFNGAVPSSAISNLFHVKENYIQTLKKRDYNQAILYLCHLNDNTKFQYDISLVKANFDYQEVVKKEIDKYNKQEKKKSKDDRLLEILELISNGTLKEYNYAQHITVEEYAKYRTKIDNAYKYYYDKNNGINRNMEVFYISGYSGTGKTFFSKKFAMEKYKENEIYVSSSGADILGEYKGQPCIILDDLRSEMGLNGFKPNDLLKLLDNNTTSSVKSRYRNKNLFNCELLIITSVLTPLQFFHNIEEEYQEEIHQFFRRCNNWFAIQDDSYNILYNIYNRDKREYFTKKHFINPYYNEMLDYIELANNSTSFFDSLNFETLAEFNDDIFIENLLNKFNPFEK